MSALARVVTTNHSGAMLGQPLRDLPEITYTFVRSGIGSASWSVPFSHPYLERNTSPTSFGPKRTDFRIDISRNNGTSWGTSFAGICAAVGLDSTRSSVEVSGVDWLAWLDQPYRFAAYTDPNARSAADVIEYWIGQTQQVIINQLLANLWDGDVNNSVHITAAYAGSGWGTVPAAAIMIGDSSTVLSQIQKAGAYNDPYGFEYWMTSDKVMHFSSPRRMAYGTTPVFGFHGDTLVADVAETLQAPFTHITWSNTGPQAVTTIGKFFGALTAHSDAPVTAAKFREWWQIVALKDTDTLKQADLNSIASDYQGYINKLTEAIGKRDRYPKHTISITFQPDPITTMDFFDNQVGKIVWVDSGGVLLPYERVNAPFWIHSQTLRCDEVGNWLCDLVLEQAYVV